jgi:hypothetical protein
LRYKVFAIAAFFSERNGKLILKLSLNMKRRLWFDGLWGNAERAKMPFVFSNA